MRDRLSAVKPMGMRTEMRTHTAPLALEQSRPSRDLYGAPDNLRFTQAYKRNRIALFIYFLFVCFVVFNLQFYKITCHPNKMLEATEIVISVDHPPFVFGLWRLVIE